MPLVNCPDCGNEISDAAYACPKCGRPTGKSPFSAKRILVRTVALWVVLIVMFLLIWQFVSPDPPKQTPPTSGEVEAVE